VVEQDRPQLVENSRGNTGVVTAAKENTSSAGTQQKSTQQIGKKAAWFHSDCAGIFQPQSEKTIRQ
jgi:hypothetical protein